MKKKRVLIVDDSKISRTILAKHVEGEAFEVCGMAGDAATALELYKELKPDIVTMDMNLPDTTGVECSRRIIAIDNEAKIVMISAMRDLALISQGKEAGIKAFLQKPVNATDLIDTMTLLDDDEATQVAQFREIYGKPFVRALEQSLAGLVKQEGEISIEEYEPRYVDIEGIAVIIGITGFTTGRVIFYLDEAVMKPFVMKILEIENIEDVDEDEIADVIEEAANVITGRGVSKINNVLENKELRLTPPGTIRGSKVHIVSPRMTTFKISAHLPLGLVQMNVGFAEGE